MSEEPRTLEENGPHTRQSLIGRLRNLENQDSWQEFFDTYWKLIFSVARKAGLSENEAEEVVQETIISVTKYIHTYRYDPQVCSFKTWLMHKTQWRIIDQVRKRPPDFVRSLGGLTDRSVTPLLDQIADPESLNLDSLWDDEWEKNLIDAAMQRIKRKIKPEHYQAFYLSAVRGLPARQIESTIGMNVAQIYLVRHRVARLIKKEVALLRQEKF